MAATRTSSKPAGITPEQRRDEIVSILAAGLVRLIGASEAVAGTTAETSASVPAEKLPESAETGLEPSRETRLSVPAG